MSVTENVYRFNAVTFLVLAGGMFIGALSSPTPLLFGGAAVLLTAATVRSTALAIRASDDVSRGAPDVAGRRAAGIVLAGGAMILAGSWLAGEGWLGLPLAIFAALLGVMFLMTVPNAEPTRDEVADLIERFVANRTERREWDDFTSLRSEDPVIERVRRLCGEVRDTFPHPHQYCSDAEIQELLRLAAELRAASTKH